MWHTNRNRIVHLCKFIYVHSVVYTTKPSLCFLFCFFNLYSITGNKHYLLLSVMVVFNYNSVSCSKITFALGLKVMCIKIISPHKGLIASGFYCSNYKIMFILFKISTFLKFYIFIVMCILYTLFHYYFTS